MTTGDSEKPRHAPGGLEDCTRARGYVHTQEDRTHACGCVHAQEDRTHACGCVHAQEDRTHACGCVHAQEDLGKERAQPFTCGSFTSRLYEQE